MKSISVVYAITLTANVGVIIAGVLVYVLGSPVPDLIIGAIISFIVSRGGIAIVAETRSERTA
ncbi:MAG: hypothetical protein OEQ90_10275 [Gammaproteobacteria bacterium]|nr:hypothetical protein [Gammaproteobacteria bacterium]